MGFFKKIGRGISKGIKKIGKGASKALNSTVGKIATTAIQFIPFVGPVTKLIGAAVSIGQKGVKFSDLKNKATGGGETSSTTTRVLDAGEGARLWKFHVGQDKWNEIKGTPINIKVEDIDYEWNGSFYGFPAVIEEETAAEGISRDDVQISYEMLDGNLYASTKDKDYRGNKNRAHGLYLAAREVFGSENNVINGDGGTSKSKKWKNEIKKIESGEDEKALLSIVDQTVDDIMGGGTGYLDYNFQNKDNPRKALEELSSENSGKIYLRYDDLIANMLTMHNRKEFIQTTKSKVNEVVLKAWRNEPSGKRSTNTAFKDRTPQEWKQHIDKQIPGSGINKRFGSNAFGKGLFGKMAFHNLEWIDAMRLLNHTARAERKRANGNISASSARTIGTSGYGRRKARERATKG